ncbi:MAG: hypothetical protein HY908_15640 [Myxococcales bacterium]|nr:hypothetical protein [Myxococcales bacterium]
MLMSPTELTCGRLLRKDLPLTRAREERALHERRYSPGAISTVREATPVNGTSTSSSPRDLALLRRDTVGDVIADYGRLDSKFATLAQLHRVPGPRAEVAMFSLGRAYVSRCVERKGPWTSGLHLLWWAKQGLGDEPQVELRDLRAEMPLPPTRHVELAKWAVVMLRLLFVSDVGHHAAQGHHRKVGALSSLAEDAVLGTGALDPGKLLRWIARTGAKRVEHALPQRDYDRLAVSLHVDAD